MTANRRIFLNIVATYGRSLYALAIGLFCGRWTLMALGEVDYGLMGVVGGMAGFVSFLNGLMSGAVSRFYAFSVGAAEKNPLDGLEECRKWFNTALLIHTTLPIALISIGYPCGVWAINHYLTIPVDRIDACIWVWRFVCISCFVGMVNVPFQAMYTAKQEIAELTIYSFATTTFNFFFVWYMVSHPAVWLTRFMAFTCILSVVPQLIITIRAVIKYTECRFVPRYLWSRKRMLDVLAFSGGRCICALSQMLSNQGSAILVNKMLGPARNAAMSIGSTVASHCASLSNSFVGAYSPAIANAAGAGDYNRMRKLMYITCSSSCAAVLLFAIPIFLEIDEVMALWLKNPPAGSGLLCLALLVVVIADRISDGLWMGIFAIGKIFAFQTWESILWFSVLPLAYIFVKFGFGIFGIGLAMVVAKVLAIIMKLIFSRKFCGISIRKWISSVALPVTLVFFISFAIGILPRLTMTPSFFRVMTTTICVELVYLPLCWFCLLTKEDREKISMKIINAFK